MKTQKIVNHPFTARMTFGSPWIHAHNDLATTMLVPPAAEMPEAVHSET